VDNGGAIFSDVQLYSMGLPFKTKPIQAAERFFERGYYTDAIEEYRNIIRLYPDDPMAVRAQFKIGLALIRMKEYEKAIGEFENILRSRYSALIPHAMGQIAQCYTLLNNPQKAEKIIINIRDKYPGSSAVIGVLSDYNNRVLDEIRKGDEKSVSDARGIIELLTRHFKSYGQFFIQSYLAYGQMFIDQGEYEKAAAVFQEIDREYAPQLDPAMIAKVRLADIEACTGSLDKAFSAYNDIIRVHRMNRQVCAEAWLGLGLINRSRGMTADALKCYNYVADEYGAFREFTAQALLFQGFTCLEKEKPDEEGFDYFKKVVSNYRDCDEPMWIARFMLEEITEKELKAKIDNFMIDYYIGEQNRAKGNRWRALASYGRFRIIVKGNGLLTRLVDRQSAYVR
jgi:tetratricopeptide (TPR) repeat protein